VSASDSRCVGCEIEEVNTVQANNRCSIQDKHLDSVFIIFGCLSLIVDKVTDETFNDNHCRQIADYLPEMLSGTVEGNIVSEFLLKHIV
jgi:hypothetical protein